MGKMEIKLSEIKEEIKNLKKLIDDYEINYLNLYNIVYDTENYWIDDGYAELFFKDIKKKKVNLDNTIYEMKELKKIYELIVGRYQVIATKNIQFDFTIKESVLNQIDNCINQYQNIISSYNGLDTSVCEGSELSSIMSSQKKLVEAQKKLTKYKQDLIKVIDYIEKTELEIARKISKIELEIIEIEEPRKFIDL